MESAIVPQKATAEVKPAPNKVPTPAVRPSGRPTVGFSSIGPRPPARTSAHANSATPTASKNGDPHVSKNLIESIPRSTIQTFIAQNSRKQRNSPVLRPTNDGRLCGRVAIPGDITSISVEIAQ